MPIDIILATRELEILLQELEMLLAKAKKESYKTIGFSTKPFMKEVLRINKAIEKKEKEVKTCQ